MGSFKIYWSDERNEKIVDHTNEKVVDGNESVLLWGVSSAWMQFDFIDKLIADGFSVNVEVKVIKEREAIQLLPPKNTNNKSLLSKIKDAFKTKTKWTKK
jgi:hypothetical protein